MKTIDDLDFSGKKALIRVDFNVPLNKDTYEITDDTRLKAPLDTIKKVLKDGGSVILMSHLGRPKNGPEKKLSLSHIVEHLSKLLNRKVIFLDDCIGEKVKAICSNLKQGEVVLLENLRFYSEETKGDPGFAKALASLGDVYINDAFGTAHRAHASTAVIADHFPGKRFFGYVMANELSNAKQVLESAQKPFTAIVGGAKVSDKILIIENLLEKVDNLIIGGGMAYTFIKAQGGSIGNSICENDKLELAVDLLAKAKLLGVEILLPEDSVISQEFSNECPTDICASGEINDGWMGLDIGPLSIKKFHETIIRSKTLLWNGPMGVFEMSNFQKGTKEIANSVAEATKLGAFSLIGGGDSAAAVNKFGLSDQVSFVSTGGGALLEYIEGKDLPGVSVIMKD